MNVDLQIPIDRFLRIARLVKDLYAFSILYIRADVKNTTKLVDYGILLN